MLKFLDRCSFLTSTVGDGPIEVGAPVSSAFLTPDEAGAENGDEIVYVIEEGQDFEIVRGVYGSTGPELTRAVVLRSKIGGTVGTTKMSLAGGARVRVIADAETLNRLTGTVLLEDTSTPALDAALGSVFSLITTTDPTIAVPSNPRAGQKIIIAITASGANRTPALNTGAGGFRFGTSISGLSQIVSGKTDYVGCIFNGADEMWDVIAYAKGY